jgi:hypothetical protein
MDLMSMGNTKNENIIIAVDAEYKDSSSMIHFSVNLKLGKRNKVTCKPVGFIFNVLGSHYHETLTIKELISFTNLLHRYTITLSDTEIMLYNKTELIERAIYHPKMVKHMDKMVLKVYHDYESTQNR